MLIASMLCNSQKPRDRKRDKDAIKETKWFGNDLELRKAE